MRWMDGGAVQPGVVSRGEVKCRLKKVQWRYLTLQQWAYGLVMYTLTTCPVVQVIPSLQYIHGSIRGCHVPVYTIGRTGFQMKEAGAEIVESRNRV